MVQRPKAQMVKDLGKLMRISANSEADDAGMSRFRGHAGCCGEAS